MNNHAIHPEYAAGVIRQIAPGALGCAPADIRGIAPMDKGMTNRTFVFSCRGQRYVMRIPGEGTEQLIDRAAEAASYRAIQGRGLCDAPVYLDPATGYKITPFIEGVRVCDPNSGSDLRRCMAFLRDFHGMDIRVGHTFDIWGQIGFYESLWGGAPSQHGDYEETKGRVLSLRPYADSMAEKRCLTHIDAVPDNFLFCPEGGGERLQLADWEYAGMQDPHVDVAMFGIYCLYDRERMDHLIDIYFEDNCPRAVRVKLYCYIAACGLLWSNWCEYKRLLGVEFGEYAAAQYGYAREYYRIAARELEDMGLCTR